MLHSPDKRDNNIFDLQELSSSLKGNYVVKSLIDKGAFGSIYRLMSSQGRTYAAKVIAKSDENKKKPSLAQEGLILKQLENKLGFPSIKDIILNDKNEILIMDLLGPNLQNISKDYGGRFSLKTVLMIGFQAIERIESLHIQGFIHRDIKPENFVIGCDNHLKKIIHLIDFGLSCPYLDENEKHIPFNKNSPISGTLYYLSVYGHLGIQPTRRDDLLSLGFMLIHLFKGELPWKNAKGTTKEMIKEVYQLKATIFLKKFCEKLPQEFISYFEYVYKLAYFEKPDYPFIKGLFIKMMNDNKIKNDGEFDWVSNFSFAKGINLAARKITGKSPNTYMKKNMDSDIFDEYLN